MNFTFHNVSIKSKTTESTDAAVYDFTFHNVSIKSRTDSGRKSGDKPLHSTMYLLNPQKVWDRFDRAVPLHSTMYLLNLGAARRRASIKDFTFHNVSIKSGIRKRTAKIRSAFTFHNVSIKSVYAPAQWPQGFALHSTMYLLNPGLRKIARRRWSSLHSTMYLLNLFLYSCQYLSESPFTFHNVSIKSGGAKRDELHRRSFTFHNVSIKSHYPVNSNSGEYPLHSTMYLLNQTVSRIRNKRRNHFTFHNVSIKSEDILIQMDSMYELYIPQCIY